MKHLTMGKKTAHSTVLLLSTRADDLTMVSSALESPADRVLTAGSHDELVALLDEEDFAVLIVAMDFPDGGGLKTAEKIKAMEKAEDVPLLFIGDKETGPGNVEKACALGAVGYLIRPVNSTMLKNRIAFFNAYHHLKKEAYQRLVNSKDRERCMGESSMQVNRAVADLAGGVAHQFNNILNVITGHVELLKMDMPENSCVESFSAVIFDSVKKMTTLTDKLLAYARAGQNRPGTVEINSILKESLAQLAYTPDRIRVETCFDPGNILVDADEPQLGMVFSALMKNAVEAIKDKGRISVRSRYISEKGSQGLHSGTLSGNIVCIEVTDNGEGMSQETSSRIFEPFFSTKFQGRGLDMAAAQGIVAGHGGFIDVKSRQGAGTTVSVFLPVSSYRMTSGHGLPENDMADAAMVLVIDDDDSIRGLTITMLNRLGYRALSAATGREAIEIVNRLKHKIDVAMLDIEMPDLKGDEIFPHLIRACPDLKVIVCSGYSVEGAGETMIKNGARLFLQKPFSFADLAMNMRQLIERRRFKRYPVRDSHVIIPSFPSFFKTDLIDISRRGAAIHAGDDSVEPLNEWKALSIVSENGDVCIADIPFQFIPRGFILNGTSPEKSSNGRRNLKFGALSPEKVRQVDSFISNFTL